MDLDLTTTEIETLLKEEGWHFTTPLEGFFKGNTVRVLVFHLKYSWVQVERIGPDEFKITPFTYKDKT
jgi:hypothetical protein